MPRGASHLSNNLPKRVAKTITSGGGATISTTQAKFGSSSLAVSIAGSNSTQYISIPSTGDMVIGTGAFTYECWVYITAFNGSAGTAGYIIDNRASNTDPNGFGISASTSNNGILVGGFGSNTLITGSNTLSTNTWYHVAVTRSVTGTITLWIDGFSKGTATSSNSLTPTVATFIGRGVATTTQTFRGYIDEVRLSNTIRYTTTFTPSTTRFQNDANTLFLFHGDESNGSTTFVDDCGLA